MDNHNLLKISPEIVLLKSLIWHVNYREKISAMLLPVDFSQELRTIYSVITLLVRSKEEISRSSVEEKLGKPLSVELFDFPPRMEEVEEAMNYMSKSVLVRRKSFEHFALFKKKIDELSRRVELGQMDPKMWSEGVKNLFADSKSEISEILKKIGELERNVKELSVLISQNSVKIMEVEKKADRSSVYADSSPLSPENSLRGSCPKKTWEDLCSRLRDNKKPHMTELKTGFTEIDNRLGGLSGVTLIYGPPKRGKSSLALQLGFESVSNNDSFLIFYTFDNRPESLYCRLVAQLAGISPKILFDGKTDTLDDVEKKILLQSMDFISRFSRRILISGIDSMPRTIYDVQKDICSVMKESGLSSGLLVIDTFPAFAEFIEVAPGINRVSAAMALLRKVQALYNIAVLATSHNGLSQDVTSLGYMADNIFDMRFNTDKSLPESSAGRLKGGAVDLWISSRDYGEYYIPMTMSLESLVFTIRTKAFKARPIRWSKNDKGEGDDEGDGKTDDTYTELLHSSVDRSLKLD